MAGGVPGDYPLHGKWFVCSACVLNTLTNLLNALMSVVMIMYSQQMFNVGTFTLFFDVSVPFHNSSSSAFSESSTSGGGRSIGRHTFSCQRRIGMGRPPANVQTIERGRDCDQQYKQAAKTSSHVIGVSALRV
jgi:hypothetical protein